MKYQILYTFRAKELQARLAHAMDEARGRVEAAKAGYWRGGARRGAEPRGLEEEQRDGREEQEDRPPAREKPQGALPQAADDLPPTGAGTPGRRGNVVVRYCDGDAPDRRRRHRR